MSCLERCPQFRSVLQYDVCVYMCDGEVRGEVESFWVWSGVGVAKSGVGIAAPGMHISPNDFCK